MAKEFDDDIEAMQLGWGEKSGLQMYRNYTKAFDDHAEKQLTRQINAEPFDIANLEQVIKLIASEDARFLPVIACGYADEELGSLFKEAVPSSVPGGKADFLGSYGPVSTLSNKIRLAHAFDLISPDLTADLNHIRGARNKLSHTWNLETLTDLFSKDPLANLKSINALIETDAEHNRLGMLSADSATRLRVALIWIVCRLTFEVRYYHRAKQKRLRPYYLYGPNRPTALSTISSLALKATQRVTGYHK